MKNNIGRVLFISAIVLVNLLAVSNKLDRSSLSLNNIFKTSLANDGENNCQCPSGYSCVNGVCVQLERQLYQGCTTSKICYWLGFIPYSVSCAGHKYNCNANPAGTTDCTNTNCECDQDPC